MWMKGLLVALVCSFGLALASGAAAQSTMIKGKVVDGDGKPMVGVAITIEFQGGVARKFQTKTDKRGEFIQLLTEGGPYKVTATADKVGSQSADVRVRMGGAADANIGLSPTTAANDASKAAA